VQFEFFALHGKATANAWLHVIFLYFQLIFILLIRALLNV